MTDTPPNTDPIARYRAVLEALDPRLRIASKLRAVFPLIEAQIESGVPHAAVLDDLKAAGPPVQTSTYATTLYCWRKAKRQADDEADQPGTSTTTPSGSPITKPTSADPRTMLADVLADQTDYWALLKAADRSDHARISQLSNRHALRALAQPVDRQMNAAFAALFA